MGRKSSVLRLADRPFATALGVLLVSSGLITVFGLGLSHDALEGLVPNWFVNALAIEYSLAGTFLLAGMAFQRADIEGAGCVLGFSGVLIRLVAVVVAFGFTGPVLSTVLLYVFVAWAFAERFRQILQHQQIVRVNATIKMQGEVSDGRSVD